MLKILIKCTVLVGFLFAISYSAYAQKAIYVYKISNDSTQNFYTKRIPKVPVRGLLVINLRSLTDSIKTYALRNGIILMSIVPLKPDSALQYFTDDVVLKRMDDMITEVVKAYHISPDKVIIGGMSVAGTGSVRYVEYCMTGHSMGHIKPIGLFAVDSPLDYERFYKASTNAVKRNFNNEAVAEGKEVIKLFKLRFGGSPNDKLKIYQTLSPFSYSAINGGNAKLLNDLSVRLYIEPDINWWIENRRRDYYDFNAIDNAALINQLKLNGNSHAELIVTSDKGYQDDGTRHPHSWSILDEKNLIDWCFTLFNR